MFPELKHSRDLSLPGKQEWADVEAVLNNAVFAGLLAYLRTYPQALLAPLMLQQTGADGTTRRLDSAELGAMDDAALTPLATACLRPGAINLQWYSADVGGYPYWHCELYPRDPRGETCTGPCCGRRSQRRLQRGENEFVQQRRSRQGRRLLIAPTAFTHTHRGNRPRNGDKFIATSWILFQRAEQLFPRG